MSIADIHPELTAEKLFKISMLTVLFVLPSEFFKLACEKHIFVISIPYLQLVYLLLRVSTLLFDFHETSVSSGAKRERKTMQSLRISVSCSGKNFK